MIEVTPELIDRYAQLMSEHAGYAVSRNTERILQDLVKQAEITERSASSIPVTLKMTVIMTEEGELKLALDDVSWKVMSRSKDDDFYTVPLDDKQMELPGLERNPPPKPVVDVKALPEHESPVKRLLHGYLELAENCKRNLEKASDDLGFPIVIPGDNDHKICRYSNDIWEDVSVPNVEKALEDMDNGMRIVFDLDGEMTSASLHALQDEGYSVFGVAHVELPVAEWQWWQTNGSGAMEMVKGYLDVESGDGRRNCAMDLINHTDTDDALLAGCLELNNLK